LECRYRRGRGKGWAAADVPPRARSGEPLIGGDFVTERFGTAFHLTGVDADAGQFPQ